MQTEYGEDPNANVLAMILASLGTELVTEPKIAAQFARERMRAKDVPILQIIFDRFRFTNNVPPESVMPYLRASTLSPETSTFSFRCWFMDRNTHLGALGEFCRLMKRTRISGKGNHGLTYTYGMQRHERLAILITAHVPLPTLMVA